MELIECRYEHQLLVQVKGRLDATWADYFKETMLEHVRRGEHHLLLDAQELTFLSSLGIRSMMVLYKELVAVQGSFYIVNAAGFVRETLECSGLSQWFSDLKIDAAASVDPSDEPQDSAAITRFVLNRGARLELRAVDGWQPWQAVDAAGCQAVRFNADLFGFGIGAAGDDFQGAKNHFGEFVAVDGQVAIQPPDERGRPDCLVSEQQFVPSLQCVQALLCQGEMSDLIRFSSTDNQPYFTVSTILSELLHVCACDSIGFVMVGEIEGLVGANLIKPLGQLAAGGSNSAIELKDWLSFSGERVFSREQVVITGIAQRSKIAGAGVFPLASCPELSAHLHAAVFPYQLLPNGCVALADVIPRLFGGPPPRAVLHLLDDNRPGNGLGESALTNAICWCAPLDTCEVPA